MPSLKSKRSFYRTRTAYSVTHHTVPPIVSKHQIDMYSGIEESPNRIAKAAWRRRSFRLADTALDRIINKLKKDYTAEDILLMITPASRHVNLYKLHVIQRHSQCHLFMITITHGELSRLKTSKAFHKYCIVFGSRYMNLMQTQTIKNLINCLNGKCCGESQQTLPLQVNTNGSNASSAGDHIKDNMTNLKVVQYQDSFIQTDPEKLDNIAFSLNDVFTLIETINQSLNASAKDIEHFFCMADKLHFALVARPQLLWTTSVVVVEGAQQHFLLESYLPGNCYVGCISLSESDLLQALDLYPKLLFNIHVIEDVFQVTPLPKKLVNVLKSVLGVLKLELLYDAVGELLFDWYKEFTYL